MRRLAVNPVPCTGCLSCETSCALGRIGFHDRRASALRVVLDPFGGAHLHVFCRQCESASCASVCPAGAIARDGVSGAWVLDAAACLRCGLCASACPFEAIGWFEGGIPVKCDLCGGEPRCVSACAFGVLRFLGEDDPRAAFRGMPPEEQDVRLGRGPEEVRGNA